MRNDADEVGLRMFLGRYPTFTECQLPIMLQPEGDVAIVDYPAALERLTDRVCDPFQDRYYVRTLPQMYMIVWGGGAGYRKELLMNTHFVSDKHILYDGRQLAPHWIYKSHEKLKGNAALAFIGPCKVDLSEMVDLEDVLKEDPIYSPLMLHIIAEFFDGDLHQTVYRQRLLIVTAKELLETQTNRRVTRRGDDIYLPRADGSDGKLSVSIATASATSTLIHTGFNIETEGTPVATVGLAELGIDVPAFATELLRRYSDEIEDIWLARCKVRAV